MRVAVVALVVTMFVAHARADVTEQDRAEARALGERAKILLGEQQFASASDLFHQAYEKTKELPYLINVAVSQRMAGIPHQSVQTYQRCLAEGGPALTPQLRAQIEADIDYVTKASGQVRVRTDGAPAEIELDGRVAGTAARDQPLLVLVATEGGKVHTLHAKRAGFATAVRTLGALRAGETIEVELAPSVIPTKGRLTINTDPPMARLSEGRVELGLAPQTLELTPGNHELWATLPDYEREAKGVMIRAGETQSITIRLRKKTFWSKHGTKVLVGSAVVLVTAGVFATRELLRPNYGKPIEYP